MGIRLASLHPGLHPLIITPNVSHGDHQFFSFTSVRVRLLEQIRAISSWQCELAQGGN